MARSAAAGPHFDLIFAVVVCCLSLFFLLPSFALICAQATMKILLLFPMTTASRVDVCGCPSNLFVDGSTGEDADGFGCEASPLKSILAAVQCASSTASIFIRPGTYVGGNISIGSSSSLTIAGPNGGQGQVIIDGNETRTFDIEPGAFVSFSNIRFTNGHAVEVEAGQTICAAPLRSSCPGRFGGAVRVTGSELLFQNCVFNLNTAMCGGAIAVSSSNATITNCTFEQNGGLPNVPPYALYV